MALLRPTIEDGEQLWWVITPRNTTLYPPLPRTDALRVCREEGWRRRYA